MKTEQKLPRVHKKTSFYICLALGVLDIFAAVQNLLFGNLEQYETWWYGLIGAAVFLGAAFFLWRRNKAEAAAYVKAKAALEEQEAAAAAAREERRRQIAEEYEQKKAARAAERAKYNWRTYPVAGVTFRNDDGSSRQKILREICDGDEFGSASVSLQEYEYEGEPAISVVTDEGVIGNIQRRHVDEVLKFFDEQPERMHVDVERFETDDGRKLYRADLVIGILKEDKTAPD